MIIHCWKESIPRFLRNQMAPTFHDEASWVMIQVILITTNFWRGLFMNAKNIGQTQSQRSFWGSARPLTHVFNSTWLEKTNAVYGYFRPFFTMAILDSTKRIWNFRRIFEVNVKSRLTHWLRKLDDMSGTFYF